MTIKRKNLIAHMRRYWPLYLFVLPAVLDCLIFRYAPMYGLQIAFKDYRIKQGMWGSEWIGFDYFERFLFSPIFPRLLRNTLSISVYSLLFGFPMPILVAFMLNELKSQKYKRIVQTVTYAPHFISTVALVGLINLLLARETGIVNQLRASIGLEKISFITKPSAYRPIYILSSIWKETGWGSIIYLAALSWVDADILEAAKIDGVSRLEKIWYIDVPSILPTAITLLIMKSGSLLSVGYEKVLLLQNDMIRDVSEVISTYTYRMGIIGGQYSYTTTIGMFNSLINGAILLLVNAIARRVNETSLTSWICRTLCWPYPKRIMERANSIWHMRNARP